MRICAHWLNDNRLTCVQHANQDRCSSVMYCWKDPLNKHPYHSYKVVQTASYISSVTMFGYIHCSCVLLMWWCLTVVDLGNEKGGIWTVACEARRKNLSATPTSGHVLAIFTVIQYESRHAVEPSATARHCKFEFYTAKQHKVKVSKKIY